MDPNPIEGIGFHVKHIMNHYSDIGRLYIGDFYKAIIKVKVDLLSGIPYFTLLFNLLVKFHHSLDGVILLFYEFVKSDFVSGININRKELNPIIYKNLHYVPFFIP